MVFSPNQLEVTTYIQLMLRSLQILALYTINTYLQRTYTANHPRTLLTPLKTPKKKKLSKTGYNWLPFVIPEVQPTNLPPTSLPT